MYAGIADPMRLVRDFLSLPLSERRALAEHYGVTKGDPSEPDFERDKRTVSVVSEQDKLVEFSLLVDAAKLRANGQLGK
jgi:hypothetical protein